MARILQKYTKQKYKTAAGKLGTIRAILQGGIFKRDQTYELQCLGVVLGDAFVQDLGMEWIMETPTGITASVYQVIICHEHS